jgi:hypothetical protein
MGVRREQPIGEGLQDTCDDDGSRTYRSYVEVARTDISARTGRMQGKGWG